MKMKTMAGICTLVVIGGLIFPLYAAYGAIGYVIASIVTLLAACMSYGIAGVVEVRKESALATAAQTQDAIIESQRQLAEQYQHFVGYTNDVQEQLLQVMEDMRSFQKGSLQLLQEATREMECISKYQQNQVDRIALQLGDFTTRIVALFEDRMKEEFESIRATKAMVGDNLSELRREVAQAEVRQADYLHKLESFYQAVAELLASNQKGIGNHFKQQMSDLKLAMEDAIEDTKDAMADILKMQRRDARELLEDIQSNQKSLMEELSAQGTRQQANLELLQKLQEEILDLNQQDMKLISKLMQEV